MSFTFRVVEVSPSDSVYIAAKKMLEFQVRSVIVANANRPRGILTYLPFEFDDSFDILLRIGTFKFPLYYWLSIATQLQYCSSKDVLKRVVAQHLSPELILVKKVS